MSSAVLEAAARIAGQGYHVVPLRGKSKFPEDKNFLDLRIHADEITEYFLPGRDWNLGVILGTEVVEGVFPIGIDVDINDEVFIARVRAAIPGDPVAKFGQKGVTFIVRAANAMKSAKFARKDPTSGKRFTVIDFMGVGNQTVIPPSIHPDTNKPYMWRSQRTLENTHPSDLPLIDEWAVLEIKTAVTKPDSPWFLINDMSWHGPGKGGTVDDSLMRSTAAMVEAGCPDGYIFARCHRAVQECLDTHGMNGWDNAIYERRVHNLVSSARDKGFESAANKKVSPALLRAKWLGGALGGFEHLRRQPGAVLRYDDGCWIPQRLEPLETRLIHEFQIPFKEMKEALSTCRSMIEVWPDARPAKVRMQNGTYDLLSGVFTEAGSPLDYILYRLPFSFDPDAVCPIYDAFIRRVFKQAVDDDDPRTDDERDRDVDLSVQNFEEFIGLTLIPDLSLQTALVIVGETRTGKSTLINLIHMLHSPDAVSASTIDTFNEERARTAMAGKLVNFSPEISSMSAMADRMFKAITGGDKVPVRELYKEQSYAVITARIIIVGNENFRFSDDSGAIERRLLYLHCGESLQEDEQDITLPDKLRTELPGIFNRMAAGYFRLKSRGKFDKPRVHTLKVEAMAEENNQALQFLIDQTHEGLRMKHPDYKVPNGAVPAAESTMVYMRYVEWAKASGHRPMNNITFGTRLTRLGFSAFLKRVGGRPIKCRALTFMHDHKSY